MEEYDKDNVMIVCQKDDLEDYLKNFDNMLLQKQLTHKKAWMNSMHYLTWRTTPTLFLVERHLYRFLVEPILDFNQNPSYKSGKHIK